MNCTRPKTAWWSGDLNENGNQYLVFNKLKSKFGIEQIVPCRGCIACRITHAAQWGRRAMDENRYHEESFFGTFTYNTESLPQNGSLHKKDFQDFLRRLRYGTGATIRYIVCGEYGAKPEIGDKFGRPHHHCLLWGWRPGDEEIQSTDEGIYTYNSEILDEYWQNGITTTGDITEASAQYVSQYIMSKIGGEQAEDHYQTTDPLTGEVVNLLPEYLNMSTKPAIGKKFFEEFKSDMYPSDQKVHKGIAYGVPRYYDKLLERVDPKMLESIKAKRKLSAAKQRADNTPERLITKDKIMQIKQHKREQRRNL